MGKSFAVALGAVLFISSLSHANVTLSDWIKNREGNALGLMLKNISPSGAAKGAVVASPSKHEPHYFYHWIRDAALIMDVVVELYKKAPTPEAKAHYFNVLMDYINFSRRNQMTPNPSGGLGEPKFEADGSAFTGSWGRPQNDGPALRAVALSRLAMIWLAEGKEQLVRQKLYESELPADRVIKADLEYVSHHWRATDFDLWEECKGKHFYTRMAQRRAMVDGAKLARFLGDGGAAGWYEQQARHISDDLLRHWDKGKKIIVTTLDRDGGIDYKWSGLDASVVLAVHHGFTGDGFFSPSDDRVLATVARLEEAFQKLYAINQKGIPGLAIGRYPEDKYDGYTTSREGNPWFLLTAAFAELYYRAASEFERDGGVLVTPNNQEFFARLGLAQFRVGNRIGANHPHFKDILSRVRAKGDDFLSRIRYHAPDGTFAEQYNRWNGYQQGAPHLTWSYGAFLTAIWQKPGH